MNTNNSFSVKLPKAFLSLVESPHPTVDITDYELEIDSNNKRHVRCAVVCPCCEQKRYARIANTLAEVKKGKFSGRCTHCRKSQKVEKGSPHPAIDWDDTISTGREGDWRCDTQVKVTCPNCKKAEYKYCKGVKKNLVNGTFTGYCGSCTSARNDVTSPRPKISKGRRVAYDGYVYVYRSGVSDDELWLWEAIKTGCFAREHRLVMSKHLGRPVRDDELVDHMDGDKANNDISNLRIYIKGKNHPGSHCGYGTYYHEWQSALARANHLESGCRDISLDPTVCIC